MALIRIYINDTGEHREKKISLLGLTLYESREYTKATEKKTVGFSSMASVPGEIEDDDYWPEECKSKKKRI